MMKTVRKKSIALLLSLSLLLSLAPCAPTAAAEETAALSEAPSLTETATDALSTEQEEISVSTLTADCGILSYVDEEVFESGNHVLRLPEEETLSTYVFLNSDGTKTVYYMDENVKFVDSDGSIQEKDLTLTAMVDGYTTTRNDIQLSLPADPVNGISLTHNGYTVSLTPQGGTLSAPVQLSGNSVCYPNYFAPASMLVYTPTISGLKEEIVLVKYAGVHTFSFLLSTDGLNLYQENGRYYLSESAEGQTRIDLGDLVTYDATGRFSVGTMTTETVTAGQVYRLTLTVDEEFLTDANTTYPVTVDPELKVSDNTHGAGAIEDVSIYQSKPTTNGNWTYLHSGYYDSTYGVARTLIRLTGLLNDSTWQGLAAGQITSASFFIYEATGTNGPPVSLYANAGSSTWTESGATWNNAGAVVGTSYSTQTPASNAYAEYNITNLLKDWKTGNANAAAGFILKSSNETNTDKAFLSSEYSTTAKRPYVRVTYAEWSNGISDNTSYYIRNVSTNRYIAIASTSDLDNTNVLTRAFVANDMYRWRTDIQSDGTYKLICVSSPTGKTLHVTGADIDLYSNYGYYTANFRLVRINVEPYEGLYHIRYQDYYLSQDSGNNVILSSTPDASSVWALTAVAPGRAVSFANNYPQDTSENPFLFFTDEHHEAFTSTLGDFGYTTVPFTNKSAQVAYPYLLNTDIFVYSGHGEASRLFFTTTYKQSLGYIGANSNMNLGDNSYYISNYSSGDLSSLRCVLYIGCKTGVSQYSYNLVDETYGKGAHFVLGMLDEIQFPDANEWLKSFFSCIDNGDSIENAIIEANKVVEERTYTYHDFQGNPTTVTLEGLPIYSIGDDTQSLIFE